MEENPGGAAARRFGRGQGEKLCVSEVTQVAVVKGGNRNLRWLWQVGDSTAKCIGNGIIITDNSGAGRDEFLHRFLYAIVRIIGKIPAYQGIFRKCTCVPQGMQHTLAAQKSGTHIRRKDRTDAGMTGGEQMSGEQNATAKVIHGDAWAIGQFRIGFL